MNEFELKKEEKIVISVRITIETLNHLQQLSQESKLSRNEIVNQCIKYALAKHKDINFSSEI